MQLVAPVIDPGFDEILKEARTRSESLTRASWAQLQDNKDQRERDKEILAAAEAAGFRIGERVDGFSRENDISGWPGGSGFTPTGGWNMGRFSGDLAKYGFGSNVPASLINTESGGRWGATNNETGSSGRKGHYGLLQFGHDRLDDGRRAGVIPASMSASQFAQNREAQVAMTNWHFNDIDRRIRNAGYDRLVGSTIGGTPITMDGMRAMAHLGGFGGLQSFIRSGGSHNPSDSFGTSLAAYGRTHSR